MTKNKKFFFIGVLVIIVIILSGILCFTRAGREFADKITGEVDILRMDSILQKSETPLLPKPVSKGEQYGITTTTPLLPTDY